MLFYYISNNFTIVFFVVVVASCLFTNADYYHLCKNLVVLIINITINTVIKYSQKEVTLGTTIKWPFKTGDLLKEAQFI